MKKLSVDLELSLDEIHPSWPLTIAGLRKRACELRDAQGCRVNLFITFAPAQQYSIERLPGFVWVSQYPPGRAILREHGATENFRFIREDARSGLDRRAG